MTQQGVSVKGGKIYESPAPARSPPRSPRWPMEWEAQEKEVWGRQTKAPLGRDARCQPMGYRRS